MKSSVIYEKLKISFDKLDSDPTNVVLQRTLLSELTQSLANAENGEEFLFGLLYKSFIEDILRTCAEDDYVTNSAVKESVRNLCRTLNPLLEHKSEDFLKRLRDFSETYRLLPNSRRVSEEIDVREVKISVPI